MKQSKGLERRVIVSNVIQAPIVQEIEQSFLDYSLSVITDRAIPAVEDGLKPVMRRILWDMLETGCKWRWSSLLRNCNNVAGIKGSPGCNGGSYKSFNSLEEGINYFLEMLYNNYYSKGLTTPEQINTRYAADKTWYIKVNNYIENIKKA